MWLRYLVLAGCASSTTAATTSHKDKRPADNRDRDQIEKAYAARDARALHELLDLVTDQENVALARQYYVKLELDALVKLDCDAFIAAFHPVKNRANPRTEFGALTADFDQTKKTHIVSTVLGIAARCRSPHLFSTAIRRAVPDATDAVWSNALIDLDRRGLPVYDAFLGALRTSTKGFDTALASKWLVATKSTADCKDLETAATRAEPRVRAWLVDFYVQKGCRTEAARGCKALRAADKTPACAQDVAAPQS
ncbi:MAG TPA: hypothetical protein VIV11_41180 [Kofleriaceae bacterium]